MRILPLLTVCVVVVGSGIVHGLISDRWGSSDHLNQAVACLKQIPIQLGAWEGQEELTISDQELQIGEIDGYLSRVYANQDDKHAVSLMIVCGRPGPISVHTPDICFRGAGYQMVGEYERHQFESEEKSAQKFEAFFADFTKPGSTGTQNLRVFWAWSDGRQFVAPENPRFAFAGNSFLYKIYVTRPIETIGEPLETDPCVSFMKLAMPALQQSNLSEQKPQT